MWIITDEVRKDNLNGMFRLKIGVLPLVNNAHTTLANPALKPVFAIENRLAGSDVNPYLAIAATLACGYLRVR